MAACKNQQQNIKISTNDYCDNIFVITISDSPRHGNVAE